MATKTIPTNSHLLNARTGAIAAILIGLIIALPAPAQVREPEYRVGPGDRISIRVFGEADLSMEILLSDSGRFSYPFLGELEVEGATLRELEQSITQGLQGSYLIDPEITVAIVEYRPFFVHGEVVSPGGIPYQPRLTVERAVALAGGFTERGSRNRIAVIREADDSRSARPLKLSDPVYAGDVLTVGQSFF